LIYKLFNLELTRCSLSHLDGGNPGCFSQLVILDEYMSRIAYEKKVDKRDQHPADYFDVIGGVGFGAWVEFDSKPQSRYH
jgi:hypothetical protein